jgi:hypothetical protein
MPGARFACNRGTMRILVLPVIVLSLAPFGGATPRASSTPIRAATPSRAATPAVVPLYFEGNRGQHRDELALVSRGSGYAFGFARGVVHARVRNSLFSLRMEGGNAATPAGEDPGTAQVNYFIGNDPDRWRRGIPTFGRVRYSDVWDGIDVVFYGNGQQLEYDVVVAPGADPRAARFTVEGASDARVSTTGELVLRVGDRDIIFSAPIAYQEIDGARQHVSARYRLDRTTVSFTTGRFDRTRPLVIDPVLIFSSFLGGSSWDQPDGVTVDLAGNTYVTGTTHSTDFPTTPGALAGNKANGDVFVAKVSVDGSTLIYATYVGSDGDEAGHAIAVDPRGAAYVAGLADTGAFPTTPGVAQPTKPGLHDGFVFELSPDGRTLVYSTYLGGSSYDFIRDIAVDTGGLAWVTGNTESADFPVSDFAYDRTHDGDLAAFVARIEPNGTSSRATYLDGDLTPFAIAVDGRSPIVAGYATVFPETTAAPPGWGGGRDGFILKISENFSQLVFGRRFGGSDGEQFTDIAINSRREIVAVGMTSSANMPTTATAEERTLGSISGDGMLAVFTREGALRFATYMGGSGSDIARGVGVSAAGITVFGITQSPDFLLLNPMQPALRGIDGFIVSYRWFEWGGFRTFSSYFGGTGVDEIQTGTVDSTGRPTFVGRTQSADFPVRRAFDSSYSPGATDGFITRIGDRLPDQLGPDDVVVHVAESATLSGNWQKIADPSAASGARLFGPADGTTTRFPASAAPVNYVEFTLDDLGEGPYRMYIRGRALNNSYDSDSVWVQFDGAYNGDIDDDPDPLYTIGTTNALPVIIEECSGCSVRGWGWGDGGYGRGVMGPPIFFSSHIEPVRVRISTREAGVSIDQVVFLEETSSPNPFDPPGYQHDDRTIFPATESGGEGGSPSLEIVLHAGVDNPQLHGAWRVVDDPTAAGGKRLHHADAGAPKVNAPLAQPTHYVELTFDAIADVTYFLHIRGRAQRDDPYNDSVYVQFSGAQPAIGTTAGFAVNLEVCSGAGLSGWGWRDANWCSSSTPGTPVTFTASGPQRIRIQTREDGISIDQIVLSANTYAGRAPGATRNDSTIVPK